MDRYNPTFSDRRPVWTETPYRRRPWPLGRLTKRAAETYDKRGKILPLCNARQRTVLKKSPAKERREVTDSERRVLDAANQFAGCIAGLHEVLEGRVC